jgi:uncharacterized protein DUF4129
MTAVITGVLSRLTLDVPVDPDGDQARQWLVNELSKPEYQASKPTLWDQISKAFWDWLSSLQAPGGVLQAPFIVILLLVIAGVIVGAFFIFGQPRRDRRSARLGALFGEGEERTADELRRSARAAASSGDWAVAIEELFRSIARRMGERVLVTTNPGTTAHGFAAQASEVFPEYAGRLRDSASVFDGVRYLGKPGSEEDYATLVTLEGELRDARPAGVEVATR